MSVAKDLWLELWEERVTELIGRGMPEAQAEVEAEAYAEEHLTDRLADATDRAMAAREEPRHSMFRDHNCAFCGSGASLCRQGNPNRCEYPIARNA